MVCFIDEINLRSLWFLLRERKGISCAWYFDPPGSIAGVLLRIFLFVGILGFPVRKNNRHLDYSELSGVPVHGEVWGNFEEHCLKEIDRIWEMKILRRCSRVITRRDDLMKVFLYAEMLRETGRRFLLLCVCEQWVACEKLDAANVCVATAFDQTGCLTPLAERFGLRHVMYSDGGLRETAAGSLAHVSLQVLLLTLRGLWFRTLEICGRSGDGIEPEDKPTLVHNFTGSVVTADISRKMEFPWMVAESVPYAQVVAVGCKRECMDESVGYFVEQGTRFFERGEHLKQTGLQGQALVSAAQRSLSLFWIILKEAFSGHHMGRFLMQRLLLASASEPCWRTFYGRLNAKVITSFFFHDLTQVMAIDALGGYAVAYQDSISNYERQPVSHAPVHVLCTFSSMLTKSYAVIDRGLVYLSCGCCHPIRRAVHAARSESEGLRRRMAEHGAEFIICFFDENFNGMWMQPDPMKTVEFYAELFRLVLDNPKVGLICKPKVMNLILQRLESIRPLLDRAMGTGRVHIFLDDTGCRSQYAATAAASADLCIGNLFGGTAVLEGVLIGKPGILVNWEKRNPPVPGVDLEGKVTFESTSALIQALRDEIAHPGSMEGFGDWSPWMSSLADYDDDLGPERIGTVLGWLLEFSEQGLNRNDALSRLAERFSQAWGADKVVVDRRENNQEMNL